MIQKSYKTGKDLQTLFQVTGRTIQAWRDKGMISYLKVGSKILFTEDSIEEFINNSFKKQFNYQNQKAA